MCLKFNEDCSSCFTKNTVSVKFFTRDPKKCIYDTYIITVLCRSFMLRSEEGAVNDSEI